MKLNPESNILYKNFSKAFVDARVKKGLTLWELSQKVGEQINTVKRIEEGEPFLIHHALWMIDVLDMDIENILAGVKTKGVTNGRKNKKGEGPPRKAVTEKDLV